MSTMLTHRHCVILVLLAGVGCATAMRLACAACVAVTGCGALAVLSSGVVTGPDSATSRRSAFSLDVARVELAFAPSPLGGTVTGTASISIPGPVHESAISRNTGARAKPCSSTHAPKSPWTAADTKSALRNMESDITDTETVWVRSVFRASPRGAMTQSGKPDSALARRGRNCLASVISA